MDRDLAASFPASAAAMSSGLTSNLPTRVTTGEAVVWVAKAPVRWCAGSRLFSVPALNTAPRTGPILSARRTFRSHSQSIPAATSDPIGSFGKDLGGALLTSSESSSPE